MPYTVLARKYRPHTFQEFVGQEHVVRALSNALDKQRLHHAYLLTGTRGVGKTSLGRILAKCLNCETEITSTPCGQCDACQAIDHGQAIDLIEIDAASNTKVEDTRDILDNVQYAPSRDRFKIYLIDEVHMLSNHSFNALLKTLEEPPEHVKFILATTDPQKLPVTILSRCLQFNLKNMPADLISQHLTDVCGKEDIKAEPEALRQLSQAANGSMRDALSLLDQAIAYSDDDVTQNHVSAMLGNVEHDQLAQLVKALANKDAQAVYTQVNELAALGIDFEQALENILSLFHQIALAQHLPALADDWLHKDAILNFAQQFSADDIQLYYQIALTGRRDLPLAPSPRAGFEMLLLRMLQFVQTDKAPFVSPKPQITTNPEPVKPAEPQAKPATSTATQAPASKPKPSTVKKPAASNDWHEIVKQLGLSGITAAFADHCAFVSNIDDTIILHVDPSHAAMSSDKQKNRIQDALSEYYGKTIRLKIEVIETSVETPAKQVKRQKDEAKQAVKTELENDPNVQNLMSQFGATLSEDSIKTGS
tara:strand:+ start:7168 stop:8778 length:1611 start_codon:yes stop_codon:yes gene_type:complete